MANPSVCVCVLSVAYIEDQHITPGTWGPPHAPRDWLSWSDFEPSWAQWRAKHQQHTKVTHIGTRLSVLNGFMFGDEPCGILLGGESQGSADENSAEYWDDIMLGGGEGAGACDNQCEYDFHCPRPGVHFPQGLSIPIPAHEWELIRHIEDDNPDRYG